MLSSSKIIIPNSLKKGGISKSLSSLSANNYPPLIKPGQVQELKESTESILAGANKVLKAIEEWQSSPRYTKVSQIDAKYPGYKHFYYNIDEKNRLRVEKELNIDVDSV